MVLFGELVIPSSRILWDDEENEQETNNESEPLKWENEFIPNKIENLLIIETIKLTEIGRTCLKENQEPICKLSIGKINIYQTVDDNYLVLCEDTKDICASELTEMLIPWLKRANKIQVITSNSAATFYRYSRDEMPSCFIRALSSTDSIIILDGVKLEAPNLVTGIAAGILSYSQHIGKSASLYVCYTDSRPLDSKTAQPVLELLQQLQVPTVRPFTFKSRFTVDSNLYM